MVLHKSIIPTYVVAITKNNGNYTAFQLFSKIEMMGFDFIIMHRKKSYRDLRKNYTQTLSNLFK